LKEHKHLNEICEQLNKFGFPATAENNSYEYLQKQLSQYLNSLIADDFNKLIQILYRLDISEALIKKVLKDNEELSSDILANIIIEREVHKIEIRKSFKSDDNIPDDEKW
jgi:hypothetical protein